jgi:ATP-dependent DNA helicase RecG
MLRFADLEADPDLLEAARYWAPRMLREAPNLAQRHLQRWLGAKQELARA